MTKRTEYILLGAVLLLAAALRVIQLDAGLWYDEILTLTQFIRLPPEELVTTYGSLNNHILYTWLAKASVAAFGEHAWSLRLPALIFGLGSIAATWQLVRESGFRQAALLVALLMAISFHHVWFSQNARGYTGMLFFATAGAAALLQAQRTDKAVWWLVFGTLSAGALLVHLSAIFVLLGEAIAISSAALSYKLRPDARSWFAVLRGPVLAAAICAALTLAVFAPLIPGMLSAFGDVAGAPEAVAASVNHDIAHWRNPLWTLWETLSSFGAIGAAIPVALLLALWGAMRLMKEATVVWSGLLISLPITLVVLVAAGMRIWPRYFFIDIGVLLACAVVGAFLFAEAIAGAQPKWLRALVSADRLKLMGAAALVAASIPLLLNNYRHPKQDFAGAQAFIQESAAAGDRIITVGLADVAYGRYLEPGWTTVKTPQEFEAAAAGGQTLWVITAFPEHVARNFPEISEELKANFERVRTFEGTLEGGDVMVWRHMASSSRVVQR